MGIEGWALWRELNRKLHATEHAQLAVPAQPQGNCETFVY